MQYIGIYLGANPGNCSALTQTVTVLGEQMAKAGYGLVYGGSSQGLMGLLAESVLSHGGKAKGIITEQLIPQEKPLAKLDELIVVDSMQERKLLMQQHSQAFMVLPGGLGTLEEAFETWNAIKIGILDKPIGFLNVEGYFDGLFTFISGCVTRGFLTAKQARIPEISADTQLLLDSLMLSEEIIS